MPNVGTGSLNEANESSLLELRSGNMPLARLRPSVDGASVDKPIGEPVKTSCLFLPMTGDEPEQYSSPTGTVEQSLDAKAVLKEVVEGLPR